LKVEREMKKQLLLSMLFLLMIGCRDGGGSTPVTPAEDGGTTTALTTAQKIKADKAWDKNYYGENILIGVIDTGVRSTHDAFKSGRVRTDLGYNFNEGTNESTDPASGDGHGTSVASIAIGSTVSKVGVAPKAEVIPLKICLKDCPVTPTNKHYADAMDWANTQGAKVINYSNYTPFASLDQSPATNDPLYDAIIKTNTNDIVVVFAAGNNGGSSPVQPAANVDEAQYKGNLIAVGNVNVDAYTGSVIGLDSRSNKAGSAKNKYIVAPGVNVNSASHANDTDYKTVRGTSFAAPQVAAAAAIIREAYPALTAPQVVEILLKSATDIGDAGVDIIYGYGLLNVDAAINLAATY